MTNCKYILIETNKDVVNFQEIGDICKPYNIVLENLNLKEIDNNFYISNLPKDLSITKVIEDAEYDFESGEVLYRLSEEEHVLLVHLLDESAIIDHLDFEDDDDLEFNLFFEDDDEEIIFNDDDDELPFNLEFDEYDDEE